MPGQSVTFEQVIAHTEQAVRDVRAIEQEAARLGTIPGPGPGATGPFHPAETRWAGVVVVRNDPFRWLIGELPARWLAGRGVFVDVIHALDPLDQLRLKLPPPSATWLFDAAAAILLPLAVAIKATGGRVFINVDDNFWAPPPWVGQGQASVTTACVGLLEARLAEADGLVVQSEGMAERVRRFNSSVTVIPQALPPLEELPVCAPRRPGGIRIGWAGTWMHEGDLELIREPMLEFLARFPEATFVLAGQCIPPWAREHPRIERHPGGVQLPAYYRWLASLDLDLFVCPLVAHPWNAAKSVLKPLEAAGLGLPVLASSVEPYAGALRHGWTAWLVENTPEAWLDALTQLAGDAALRARLAAGGRAWAATQTIETTGPLWARLWGMQPEGQS